MIGNVFRPVGSSRRFRPWLPEERSALRTPACASLTKALPGLHKTDHEQIMGTPPSPEEPSRPS